MNRTTWWVGVAVAVLAAAWLLLDPHDDTIVAPNMNDDAGILIHGVHPWLIGDMEDAFSYAGENVAKVWGEAIVSIDPVTNTGLLEVSLQPDEILTVRMNAEAAEESILLRMQIEDPGALWADQAINKGSVLGDARLPLTHATFAGSGTIEQVVDGVDQSVSWTGFWFFGDALRQADGSIRNRGLVFSPLLRDPSVFSDPTRSELTLLVYESSSLDTVKLHLVFPDPQIADQ